MTLESGDGGDGGSGLRTALSDLFLEQLLRNRGGRGDEVSGATPDPPPGARGVHRGHPPGTEEASAPDPDPAVAPGVVAQRSGGAPGSANGAQLPRGGGAQLVRREVG